MSEQEKDPAVSIPNLFTDEAHYEYLESLSEFVAVQMYEVAKSLVSNGFTIIPCKAFRKDKYDAAVASGDKRAQGTYGGKCPAVKRPYDEDGDHCNTLDKVDDWWHPDHGNHRGQNIGILTGHMSGVSVVDIDTEVEVKTDPGVMYSGWDSIMPYLPVTTPKVRSGGASSNGQHLYFRYKEGLTSCTTKLLGIDFRTDGGHIMAPFSRCQGVYEVVEFGEFTELPEDLMIAMFPRLDNVVDMTTKKPVPSKERDPVPMAMTYEALKHLPIGNFDGVGLWLKIAMSIHAEYPNEDGWELLDLWSRGAITEEQEPGGYDYKGNRMRWDSFSESGDGSDLTIGTLFTAAKNGMLDGFQVGEGTWTNPRASSIKVDRGAAVIMMNNAYVVLNPIAWKGRKENERHKNDGEVSPIKVPSGTIFSTGVQLHPDNWKMKEDAGAPEEMKLETVAELAAEYETQVKQDAKGNPVFGSITTVWRKSPAKRVMRGIGYWVSRKAPVGMLNLWTGWTTRPKKSSDPCAMFRKHTLEILCNGDEEKYSWVMNRLAWVAQRGDINLGSALVINGAEGLGKGIWWEYIEKTFGKQWCHYTTNPETFTSRFSGEELAGKFIVNADEALFSGDMKADNNAKGLIGNSQMREEGKGKATKVGQNVVFFIFFSNHEDPVMVTRGNRRFTIMTGSSKYSDEARKADPAVDKEANNHFKKLAEEREGDGPAQLMYMLLNWNIDESLARTSLTTVEKVSAIQRQTIGRESIVEWMLMLLEHEPSDEHGRWGNEVKSGALYEEYNDWVKNNKHNHASRGWKALSVTDFKKALTGAEPDKYNFGFVARRLSGGNFYTVPERNELIVLMREKYPDAIKLVPSDYDASKENDF